MRSCCALYVDAGYLYAAAATLITGTSLRSGVRIDHEALIDKLVAQVEWDSGLPLLRVNWYDSGSAPDGRPGAQQSQIGLLPRVKLRLGRLSHGGEQKGVDLRLGLDLVTQARNRIVDVVYLLSGDDDLTEAVEEAQAFGVQVMLLGVPDREGRPHGVAVNLQRESDGLRVIEADAISETVRSAPRDPVAPRPDVTAAVAAIHGAPTRVPPGHGAEAPSPTAPPKPGPPRPAVPTGPEARPARPRSEPTAAIVFSTETGQQIREVGLDDASTASDEMIDGVCRRVLAIWASSASDDQQQRLLRNRGSIPSDIDRALLQDLSTQIGIYEIPEPDRVLLRARFWKIAPDMLPQ